MLVAQLAAPGGGVTADGATMVEDAVSALLVAEQSGTQAETVAFNDTFMQLEITVYYEALPCAPGVASPECERQGMEADLSGLLRTPSPQLQAAEQMLLSGLQLVSVTVRQPPQPPSPPAPTAEQGLLPPGSSNSSATGAIALGQQGQGEEAPWAPWQLDRIDQHRLPQDGKPFFRSPAADGTGINIYLLSSGACWRTMWSSGHPGATPQGSGRSGATRVRLLETVLMEWWTTRLVLRICPDWGCATPGYWRRG